MKRALLVGTGTVLGLGTVLVLNPAVQTVTSAMAAKTSDAPAATPLPAGSAPAASDDDDDDRDSDGSQEAAESGRSVESTTTPAAPSAGSDTAPGTAGSGSTSGASGTAGSGAYAGSVAHTRWGPVQVSITVTSGKITDVSAPVLPDGDGRSYAISQQAGPMLIQQTLTAQSAQIDGVSGATYTSVGFAQSLQSALTQAGL